MKDFKFIASKLFKRCGAVVVLAAICCFTFCLSVFNKPVVYASEQIALVECVASVQDGENKNVLSKDVKIFSDSDNSSLNFCDVDVELNSTSKLEYVYNISNISDDDCLVNLSLSKNSLENFKVEYYIDDNFVGDLTKFNHIVSISDVVEIRVVIYVDDVGADANLAGALELSF